MARTRHMKLPNGFGQITKLKGNLRKPFRVMITVGISDEGRPICKTLKPVAYFETYNDAYMALMNHHQNPYNQSKDKTLEEVYNEWMGIRSKTASQGLIEQYQQGWKRLSNLHNMRMSDIKPRIIREEIEKYRNINTGPKMMRTVLNFLFDYAVENEIVDKNYSRNTKISIVPESTKHHISFTDKEISTLWQHTDDDIVKMILIQCYSGMRPGELVDLRLTNISLDENLIIGGMKTAAGRDRRIPIHPEIKEFIKYFAKIASGKNSEFLFPNSNNANQMNVKTYRIKYNQVIKDLRLNPEHKAHDPRKFFVTEAKKYQLDEYAIKLIIGHTIEDLTERVYTERSFDWLYSEMMKISVCRNDV